MMSIHAYVLCNANRDSPTIANIEAEGYTQQFITFTSCLSLSTTFRIKASYTNKNDSREFV